MNWRVLSVLTHMRTVKWNLVRGCAIALTIVAATVAAQTAPYDSAKPLQHATLFAPGTISTGDYESHYQIDVSAVPALKAPK